MVRSVVRGGVDLGLELKVDAEFARTAVQEQEQLFAPDAGKSVASRYDALAAIMDSNVIPIGEVATNGLRADRIIGHEVVERIVRQHHAPTERVIRPVSLDHSDVVGGIAQLHADREVEARRTATEARNFHVVPTFSTEDLYDDSFLNYFKVERLGLKCQIPRNSS